MFLARPALTKLGVALTNFWFSFLYALLEDKDPNKSRPSVDLFKAKDHSTVLCKKVDLLEAKGNS